MPDQELINLIQKYLDGTCTAEEQQRIEQWYEEQSAGDMLFYDDDDARLKLSEERSFAIIRQQMQRRKLKLLFIKRIAAAAVLVVSVVAFFYFTDSLKKTIPQTAKQALTSNDIRPGGHRAVLTLADGKRVQLSDAKSGLVVDASKLSYSDGEELKASSNFAEAQTRHNTMSVSTPRGGTYQVILPDGSKVWLNAASRISFPAVFSGNERRVQLFGEGYFEVASNKAKPFKVALQNGAEVQVTGTHFNVMDYEEDRQLSAILMEGGVRFAYGKKTVALKPGQQALLDKHSGSLSKSTADLEEALAWKNGYFLFNEENIHSIMRKISRWYDVEVVYEGDMAAKDFSGTVSRYKNVSEVLKMLELTGIIHFNVQGRRITVMP